MNINDKNNDSDIEKRNDNKIIPKMEKINIHNNLKQCKDYEIIMNDLIEQYKEKIKLQKDHCQKYKDKKTKVEEKFKLKKDKEIEDLKKCYKPISSKTKILKSKIDEEKCVENRKKEENDIAKNILNELEKF